jgi:hypothetical protein
MKRSLVKTAVGAIAAAAMNVQSIFAATGEDSAPMPIDPVEDILKEEEVFDERYFGDDETQVLMDGRGGEFVRIKGENIMLMPAGAPHDSGKPTIMTETGLRVLDPSTPVVFGPVRAAEDVIASCVTVRIKFMRGKVGYYHVVNAESGKTMELNGDGHRSWDDARRWAQHQGLTVLGAD